MAGTRKMAAILVSDVVGYAARRSRRGSDSGAAPGAPKRPDRSDHRRAPRPHRQAHRRWRIVEFRSVVDAVNCAIEVQRAMVERNAGGRAGQAHRISHRHPSRRRGRGERRRSDGRRRQYRRAAGGHRQAGGDLSFRASLLAGQGAARSRGQRSRPDPTQEHRRTDPGLFARSRHARSGEARADPGARKIRPAAPLDGRLAVRQYRRRPGTGAFRRRRHGEPDDRPLTDTRGRRDRPQYGVHLQGQAARCEDRSGAS